MNTTKLLCKLQQLLLGKASHCLAPFAASASEDKAEAADTLNLLSAYTRLLVQEARDCLTTATELCRHSAYALARLMPLLTESALFGRLLPDFLLSLLVLQNSEQKNLANGKTTGALALDQLRLDTILQALLPPLDTLSRLSYDASVADRHEAMLPVSSCFVMFFLQLFGLNDLKAGRPFLCRWKLGV